MQASSDPDAQSALKLLKTTGECKFDLTIGGARLQPVAFGSRACTLMEAKLHSFTGEAACGRWAIGQNRRYLWGTHFYWLCDCLAIKQIVDYDGTISLVCRWAQELLGYDFTVLHRPNRMMIDVDAYVKKHQTSGIIRGECRSESVNKYFM